MNDRCTYCRLPKPEVELCHHCRTRTCATCHLGDKHLARCPASQPRNYRPPTRVGIPPQRDRA